MRPQLNIPLDDSPELLEKLRKFCKLKGFKISSFCIQVLNEAIEREVAGLGSAGQTVSPLKGDIDFMFERLGGEIAGLRSSVAVMALRVDELSANSLDGSINALAHELKLLGDSYNEDIPKLKNSVWLLEQRIPQVNKPQKTQDDETLSQLKCLGCGQVGGHKRSGFNRQGKQLYYCGNPDHVTKEGGRLRSHKFEFVDPDIARPSASQPQTDES